MNDLKNTNTKLTNLTKEMEDMKNEQKAPNQDQDIELNNLNK
jgi:hypothetical protein